VEVYIFVSTMHKHIGGNPLRALNTWIRILSSVLRNEPRLAGNVSKAKDWCGGVHAILGRVRVNRIVEHVH